MAKLKADAFTQTVTRTVDTVPFDVPAKSSIADVLERAGAKNVSNVQIPTGELIPASRFTMEAPAGFTTNISPIEKGGEHECP